MDAGFRIVENIFIIDLQLSTLAQQSLVFSGTYAGYATDNVI